ncbi:LysR family transcriptional regulator [Salinisphaera sp. Q1T1-3]|uniref:LysR family transcriptional regulator n=1 Tax=Salinisphaera sp. Q1T1-3 TaxID=2321229 RepID=UPI000E7136CF|nr:LysR family transcriptional regulator [Salinisphaera sp. Q1T1-3]RJS93510.1 LysR family transcriptional regulator [Salinisphaera sp. Q1T1-3]
MQRDDWGDLAVFAAVAEEMNFTRTAVRLGISQSAVSHTIRRLETSVGLKLLNRTSRRVSLTDAGDKLLATLQPGLARIESRIEELRALGDAPRGRVRLTASKAAARTVLMPVLSQVVRDYPDIQIELNVDARLSNLAEERFDAGIRLGEFVGPDMIAVPVGPPLRMAAVATPDYFRARGLPEHPSDLDAHDCLALRFHPHATTYAWEFENAGEEIVKPVSGPFIFSEGDICIEAARAGHGIAFVTEPEVIDAIESGALWRVLTDWCPPFEGYHLFYPDRRRVSSALRLVIDRLKQPHS